MKKFYNLETLSDHRKQIVSDDLVYVIETIIFTDQAFSPMCDSSQLSRDM